MLSHTPLLGLAVLESDSKRWGRDLHLLTLRRAVNLQPCVNQTHMLPCPLQFAGGWRLLKYGGHVLGNRSNLFEVFRHSVVIRRGVEQKREPDGK